jgi:phospholipid/cholesterol/gamma-HCH transport system ATP-binding protein
MSLETTDQQPVVRIEGLSKSFDGVDVLKEVNLTINPAENVVVLGKSGSGKSTLIKCMIGLCEPDEGSIFIMGQDIAEISYEELNQLRINVGFLFQGGALYDSMSVAENLAFPLRHHQRHLGREKIAQMIQEALDNVGLPDAGNKMPSELSGGMSKRIGLARTLILQPSIMLYDEPTTGLDTATAKEISQLILDMRSRFRITSLIITHDISCAKMTADRIVMLREGALVAEGTYDELAKSGDAWISSFFN